MLLDDSLGSAVIASSAATLSARRDRFQLGQTLVKYIDRHRFNMLRPLDRKNMGQDLGQTAIFFGDGLSAIEADLDPFAERALPVLLTTARAFIDKQIDI